jgi:two-component system sensor histidine kinase QseC
LSRSLRIRLLLGSTLASGVTLAVLSVATFVLMRRTLIADFDSASLAKAKALSGAVERKGGHVIVESAEIPAEFTRTDRPEYFAVDLQDGTSVVRSSSLGNGRLADVVGGSDTRFQSLALPDGRHGRLVAIHFTPRVELDDEDDRALAATSVTAAPQTAVLTLARDTGEIDTTLSHLKAVLASLSVAALVVSGAALLLVVRGALRPLDRLARDIESFPEGDLSCRLNAATGPTELQSVVERFNGLLCRLQDAFLRERSFTADVAHELRTPIAGLHTTLQVGRSRRREPDGYEALIDKCLKMTGGIGDIVETLLMLARADAGQLPVKTARVDLAELIDECWTSSFRQRAADRRLNVELLVAWPCEVESDPEKVAMILNNLFDNAVSYADEGGSVCIETIRNGRCQDLVVTNTGNGLTDEDAKLAFERFWRGDQNRSSTGVHCGLGLSLCQRLAALLGLQLSAESREGKFRVSLAGFVSEISADAARTASPRGATLLEPENSTRRSVQDITPEFQSRSRA